MRSRDSQSRGAVLIVAKGKRMLSRRKVRINISEFSQQGKLFFPLVKFIRDCLIWSFGIYLVGSPINIIYKIIGGTIIWLTTIRLFVIGHEAGHGRYVSSVLLNKIIGRLAFLPSGIPLSLWEHGHNVGHHGYPNLILQDHVWAPMSRDKYLTLSKWRKGLERAYRSGFGSGLYQLIEVWHKRLLFPRRIFRSTKWQIYFYDSLFVSAFLVAWIGLLVSIAVKSQQSILLIVCLGFFLPWFALLHALGLILYLHHTHPEVHWYDNKKDWLADHGYITATVNLEVPWLLDLLLLNIMNHAAHHVDVSVPYHLLPHAQDRLMINFPKLSRTQKFSWKWYFQTVRICKLYDFKEKSWTPFPFK
jgi:omega-6 fatty acid desaturase (delta-12 desaturase)